MTGNQPGHRVVRHGIGHGPHRARRADTPRDIFIRHHASRRNAQQRLPDLDLKVGPAYMQIDAGRFTVDAREQPACQRGGHAWRFLELRPRPFGSEFSERALAIFFRHETQVTNAT